MPIPLIDRKRTVTGLYTSGWFRAHKGKAVGSGNLALRADPSNGSSTTNCQDGRSRRARRRDGSGPVAPGRGGRPCYDAGRRDRAVPVDGAGPRLALRRTLRRRIDQKRRRGGRRHTHHHYQLKDSPLPPPYDHDVINYNSAVARFPCST